MPKLADPPVVDDSRELSITALDLQPTPSWWEQIIEWWESLPWWQKTLIATSAIVGVGGSAVYVATRRRR